MTCHILYVLYRISHYRICIYRKRQHTLDRTWGFQENIKDVKDIMNIVDDNNNIVDDNNNIVDDNNNNKGNYSDVKTEDFIIKLTQYLNSWT